MAKRQEVSGSSTRAVESSKDAGGTSARGMHMMGLSFQWARKADKTLTFEHLLSWFAHRARSEQLLYRSNELKPEPDLMKRQKNLESRNKGEEVKGTGIGPEMEAGSSTRTGSFW